MLGYFALYGGNRPIHLLKDQNGTSRRRGLVLGRLPHEIAALNAR